MFPLQLSRNLYKSPYFLQNEPNFQKGQMNVNKVLTMNYEKKDTWWTGKKRTQTNPNEPNLPKAQNERNLFSHKGLSEYLHLWSPAKQTQTKPIKLVPSKACPERSRRVEPIPKNPLTQSHFQLNYGHIPILCRESEGNGNMRAEFY